MKKNSIIKKVISSGKNAQKVIAKLTPQKKTQLELDWDIEHAYYSSALEGSKLDRTEFEKLAETVKA